MIWQRRPTSSAGHAGTAVGTARTTPGSVYPGEVRFPFEEVSAYTGAAVILAADAIDGASPASGVFVPRVATSSYAGSPTVQPRRRSSSANTSAGKPRINSACAESSVSGSSTDRDGRVVVIGRCQPVDHRRRL